MGRGRAKAKQTKVARELKYFSPDTDLNALERELRAASSSRNAEEADADRDNDDDGDDFDDYAAWASGRS